MRDSKIENEMAIKFEIMQQNVLLEKFICINSPFLPLVRVPCIISVHTPKSQCQEKVLNDRESCKLLVQYLIDQRTLDALSVVGNNFILFCTHLL